MSQSNNSRLAFNVLNTRPGIVIKLTDHMDANELWEAFAIKTELFTSDDLLLLKRRNHPSKSVISTWLVKTNGSLDALAQIFEELNYNSCIGIIAHLLSLESTVAAEREVDEVAKEISEINTLEEETCIDFGLEVSTADIRLATLNHTSPKLGAGGFGEVYKGTFCSTEVAVKKFKLRSNEKEKYEQFKAEINVMKKFQHQNIVQLIAYCVDYNNPALVFEYMEKGSLADNLNPAKAHKFLDWNLRLGIAVDVALGISFLHTAHSKPQIHGDIKSANILLTAHNQAKISDFGLSKLTTGGRTVGKFTHVSKPETGKLFGTMAYLPHEFISTGSYHLSTDCFSFGVVLFELLSSKQAERTSIEHRGQKCYLKDEILENIASIDDLSNLHCFIDSKLDIPPGCSDDFATIALRCMQNPHTARPKLDEVHQSIMNLKKKCASRATAKLSKICNSSKALCELKLGTVGRNIDETLPSKIHCEGKNIHVTEDVRKVCPEGPAPTTAKETIVPLGNNLYQPEGCTDENLYDSTAIESKDIYIEIKGNPGKLSLDSYMKRKLQIPSVQESGESYISQSSQCMTEVDLSGKQTNKQAADDMLHLTDQLINVQPKKFVL